MATRVGRRRARPLSRLAGGRIGRFAAGDVALGALAVFLATVAQLLRQPDVPAWDTMWQEDGWIFMTGALSQSLGDELFEVYHNYLHWAPRVIAHFTALFPLGRTAWLMAVLTCVVVALVSLYIYFASARLFEARWSRAAMAAAPILLPAGGYEANANVTNIHWYLTFGAFWVCVANPRTRPMLVGGAVLLWFAVMSDASTIAFLPLLLLQLWRDGWRRPSAWLLPALMLVAFALQWKFALSVEGTSPYTEAHWDDVPAIYGLRVAGSFITGDVWLDELYGRFGYVFPYLSIAVVLAVVGYALWAGRDRWTRVLVLACFAYSVAFMTAACMLRGTGNWLNRGSDFTLNGSRFTVLPVLLLVAVALVAVERRPPRLAPPAWRRVQLLAALVAAVVVAGNYAIPTTRTPGPAWRAGVDQARLKCAGKLPGNNQSVKGPARPGPRDLVVIFVSLPGDPEPPWGVTATCEQIQKQWF